VNELEFANRHLQEFKVKGNELISKLCPFCMGGQHNDKETFSLNTDKHVYACARGKCGERGTFKELCEKYNETADYYLEWLKEHNISPNTERIYTQPQYKINDLSQTVIKYFEARGISEDTLLKTKVKSIHNKGFDYGVFQFFQNGKLVMNKIRLPRAQKVINGKKELKEWKEKGGKHVLWNMDSVNTDIPVILTEGMVDALSVYEAGCINVVSIPSGTLDMTWIENCYEWIQSVKEWVLYTDNDEAGEKLNKELIQKFKSYKAKIVTHELKDANEELVTFGKEYIVKAIENAKIPNVEGISNLSNVKMVDPSKMERCPTGNSLIDQFAGGYIFPSLNIWTGERGSGKSTVVGQTLLNCMENGYKVFVYTGELASGFFKLWLYLQAVGEKNIITEIDLKTNLTMFKPKPELIAKLDKWIDNKIYIYDDTNTNEQDKLLELMDEAYQRYNCRIFLIDNLMTIKFNSNRDGIWRGQSDFIDLLRLKVLKNNWIINVVVHPNKAGEIGGTGDIRNAAFNEFWVKKLGEDEEQFPGCNSSVSITKNRYYSDSDISRGFYYSKKSKRVYGKKENERIYGWQENNVEEVDLIECPF